MAHLPELHGLPSFDFPGAGDREADDPAPDLPAAGAVAWRIAMDDDADEDWEAVFARFCSAVDTAQVRALIAGLWQLPFDHDSSGVISALLAARGQLPALRALFLGDIDAEECEISWICQADVSRLLSGFPHLEEFGVRGGQGLRFHALRHERLRSLTVESGGLPAEVVRGIGESDLPALEHLDLWLGTPDYGGNCEVADLAPILSGMRLPRLRHLALRDSEIQDEVAAAVASAAVVARLQVLDMSMGTLGDEGAEALLAGQPLTHLDRLDLHHHFISDPLQDRLRQSLEPAGVTLNLDNTSNDASPDNRWVAVGE
jgi:hypothetical protein